MARHYNPGSGAAAAGKDAGEKTQRHIDLVVQAGLAPQTDSRDFACALIRLHDAGLSALRPFIRRLGAFVLEENWPLRWWPKADTVRYVRHECAGERGDASREQIFRGKSVPKILAMTDEQLRVPRSYAGQHSNGWARLVDAEVSRRAGIHLRWTCVLLATIMVSDAALAANWHGSFSWITQLLRIQR